MRAARFYNQGDIRVEEVPEPRLSDGKVLVDVEWCGICGSDLHDFTMGPFMLPTKPHRVTGETIPLAQGHEFCGRVRNPPDGSKLKDGEAVMVDPRMLCRECMACKSGKTACCQRLGYIGGATNGGYAERVVVEERSLYPLGNIPLEYAAVIEPLAVVHHAVKESAIQDWNDKSVLVLGGGPIGFALVLLLRAHGASNITVSEPASIRREQVAEFAKNVINPINENVGDVCRSFTNGKGVDVVFDCAGVPIALEAGFDALGFGGLFIEVAVWEKPMTIPSLKLLAKHITLKGVFIFNTEDFQEVMQWMAEGRIKGYEKMVTARIGLDDIVDKGFKELVNNKDSHIKILVNPRLKE
ncbi:GroES-like protein [Rhizodiscina lignyota]|uniref:GroES-like protein n=1 Tax=Rhizodiscina lignyota TaxID=1504668 RepID=A0A9P4I120_9PEZI|nr:GroES-like protein [Rhizodiscina lignyota]